MAEEQRMSGRAAIITGGSSGIGLAIAQRLARDGVAVAVLGTNPDKAEQAAAQLAGTGAKAIGLAGDVGRFAEAVRLVDEAEAALGSIDILVNCAGVWYPTPTGELVEADVDRMIATNLKGTIAMINAVAPRMKARRTGAILNFASVAAYVSSPGFSLYTGLKAAIVAMTKTYALELAPFDIQVNAIAPGNTATPINEHVRNSPEHAERLAWIERTTPSNRAFTPPEEIAEAAHFILSGTVRAMHGTTLILDEGRAAGQPAR